MLPSNDPPDWKFLTKRLPIFVKIFTVHCYRMSRFSGPVNGVLFPVRPRRDEWKMRAEDKSFPLLIDRSFLTPTRRLASPRAPRRRIYLRRLWGAFNFSPSGVARENARAASSGTDSKRRNREPVVADPVSRIRKLLFCDLPVSGRSWGKYCDTLAK